MLFLYLIPAWNEATIK